MKPALRAAEQCSAVQQYQRCGVAERYGVAQSTADLGSIHPDIHTTDRPIADDNRVRMAAGHRVGQHALPATWEPVPWCRSRLPRVQGLLAAPTSVASQPAALRRMQMNTD
jgi:hypothetical protein